MQYLVTYALHATEGRLAVMADALSALRATELWPTTWLVEAQSFGDLGSRTPGEIARHIDRHLQQYALQTLKENFYRNGEGMGFGRVLQGMHCRCYPGGRKHPE